MHWTATAPQVKWSTLAQYENRNSYPIEEEIMTYSVYSHRKLAVALFAAALAGLTARALLAQGKIGRAHV